MAIQVVMAAQADTAKAQHQLAQAEIALASALTASMASTSHGGGTTSDSPSGTAGHVGGSTDAQPDSAGGRITSPGVSGTIGSAGQAGRGEPASPEQLAADQANVDAAEAALTAAEQDRTQAEITAPIAGTVASVGTKVGEQVTPSTAAVVIVAPGAQVATMTVSDTEVSDVRPGMAAKVTPTGTSRTLTATVGSVDTLNPNTNADSTAYTVTVAIDRSAAALPVGASATVAVLTGRTAQVLTVPTSAVRTVGNVHAVSVLKKGAPVRTLVQTGTVGPARTQIRSGLATGTQVVLADLELPPPDGGADTLRSRAVGGARAGAGGAGGSGGARGPGGFGGVGAGRGGRGQG
ncbi:efflux RND transporter periplasmic adaptor subunit [Actinopolymorpha pittospori]